MREWERENSRNSYRISQWKKKKLIILWWCFFFSDLDEMVRFCLSFAAYSSSFWLCMYDDEHPIPKWIVHHHHHRMCGKRISMQKKSIAKRERKKTEKPTTIMTMMMTTTTTSQQLRRRRYHHYYHFFFCISQHWDSWILQCVFVFRIQKKSGAKNKYVLKRNKKIIIVIIFNSSICGFFFLWSDQID